MKFEKIADRIGFNIAVSNPAIVFARKAKAGYFDDVDDTTYCKWLDFAEYWSKYWSESINADRQWIPFHRFLDLYFAYLLDNGLSKEKICEYFLGFKQECVDYVKSMVHFDEHVDSSLRKSSYLKVPNPSTLKRCIENDNLSFFASSSEYDCLTKRLLVVSTGKGLGIDFDCDVFAFFEIKFIAEYDRSHIACACEPDDISQFLGGIFTRGQIIYNIKSDDVVFGSVPVLQPKKVSVFAKDLLGSEFWSSSHTMPLHVFIQLLRLYVDDTDSVFDYITDDKFDCFDLYSKSVLNDAYLKTFYDFLEDENEVENDNCIDEETDNADVCDEVRE